MKTKLESALREAAQNAIACNCTWQDFAGDFADGLAEASPECHQALERLWQTGDDEEDEGDDDQERTVSRLPPSARLEAALKKAARLARTSGQSWANFLSSYEEVFDSADPELFRRIFRFWGSDAGEAGDEVRKR